MPAPDQQLDAEEARIRAEWRAKDDFLTRQEIEEDVARMGVDEARRWLEFTHMLRAVLVRRLGGERH